MKKLFIAVVILVLLTGGAGAHSFTFKMIDEPRGWQGMTWGTSLWDVASSLNWAGILSVPLLRDLGLPIFVKKSATNTYLGYEWDDTFYIFSEYKLCGVLLETNSSSGMAKLRNSLIEAPQGAASRREGEDFGLQPHDFDNYHWYIGAKGTYCSLIYIGTPRSEYYLLIGLPSVVNGWIDQINSIYPEMNQ